MRVAATVTSISWIPSELVSGAVRKGFDLGLAHYDPPPPEALASTAEVHARSRGDEFRFANVLSGWLEVVGDRIVDAGFGPDSDLVMGSTTVRAARLGATFRAASMPTLQPQAAIGADSVRFQQTVGGHTGVPLPPAPLREGRAASGTAGPAPPRERSTTRSVATPGEPPTIRG